jgi:hypothetical protein
MKSVDEEDEYRVCDPGSVEYGAPPTSQLYAGSDSTAKRYS